MHKSRPDFPKEPNFCTSPSAQKQLFTPVRTFAPNERFAPVRNSILPVRSGSQRFAVVKKMPKCKRFAAVRSGSQRFAVRTSRKPYIIQSQIMVSTFLIEISLSKQPKVANFQFQHSPLCTKCKFAPFAPFAPG